MNIFHHLKAIPKNYRITYMTITSIDWRIFVIFSGLIVMCMGLVPLLDWSILEGSRFKELKQIFLHPLWMATVYILFGLGIIFNIRNTNLNWLAPITLFLIVLFGYSQITPPGISFGFVCSVLVFILLTYGWVRGGGFMSNLNVKPSGVTEREELEIIRLENLEYADKVIKSKLDTTEEGEDDDI